MSKLSSLIPRATSPLGKFIRTSEGVLTYVFGLAIILIPIITSALPPALHQSLIAGRIVLIVAIVSRTGLKVIAVISGSTGLSPAVPAGLPDPNAIADEVKQAEAVLAELQAAVGTAADQIEHGLSPAPDGPAGAPPVPLAPES